MSAVERAAHPLVPPREPRMTLADDERRLSRVLLAPALL